MNKKHLKKLVVGLFLFELIISVYTLLQPKEYMSYATILAPESESPGVVLNTPYGQLQNPEISNEAVSSQAIIALLLSRRLAKKVVKQFKLSKIYKNRDQEILLKKFFKNVSANLDPEKGLITLSFISTKSHLTRDVVLYMLNQLDTLNTALRLTSKKPLARVIDYPEIPHRKYKPHLSHNIVIGFFIYMAIITSFYAVKEVLREL